MNKPEIIFTHVFQKDSKRLFKKYKSIKVDIFELVEQLESNPFLGVSLGKDIFKIRLKISSKNKGKRSGARVITYIKHENKIILVKMYDKSEIENISIEEILKIISSY